MQTLVTLPEKKNSISEKKKPLLEFSVGIITKKLNDRSLKLRTTNFQWLSAATDKSTEMNNTVQLANERDHCRCRNICKSQKCAVQCGQPNTETRWTSNEVWLKTAMDHHQ